MKDFNVGVIGLGPRGSWMLKCILEVENVKVTAVCDLFEDRVEKGAQITMEKKGYRPEICTQNWEEVVNSDRVDVIAIFAAWEVHIPISIAAMKLGKPVAVEVAGAYSVEQCWDVVRTYEETKTPIMMLENCCFGRVELMLSNMIEKGVFGKVVHLNGAYQHDLRDEITGGGLEGGKHYRFRNYVNRNCENYPTHELGPLAQMIGINKGNRMVSLVSVASKGVGLKEYIAEKHPDNKDINSYDFQQGDVVTTVIKCAHGETITLTLTTTLPRFYTRDLKVFGTKACYEDNSKSIFIDGVHNHEKNVTEYMNNIDEYKDEYEHPIWKKYIEDGVHEGHGGMDWLVINAFFDALKEDKPMPVDVYDMAAWMCITPLSERSIATGQMVEIPDFTNGKWLLK